MGSSSPVALIWVSRRRWMDVSFWLWARPSFTLVSLALKTVCYQLACLIFMTCIQTVAFILLLTLCTYIYPKSVSVVTVPHHCTPAPHWKWLPVSTIGVWIQGLLPGFSGDERRWFAVNVARQCCQRAERNATVDTSVSYLRPGEAEHWAVGVQFLFFRLISTLRCPLLRLDEGLHPKQDPADSDSAAAFRVGLHLWSCGSRCLLPLRGQISGRSEYFNISVLKCRSLTVLIVTMSLLDSL